MVTESCSARSVVAQSTKTDQPVVSASDRAPPVRRSIPTVVNSGTASIAGSDASRAGMVQVCSSGPRRTPGGMAAGMDATASVVVDAEPIRTGSVTVRTAAPRRSTSGTPVCTTADRRAANVSSVGASIAPPTSTSSGASRAGNDSRPSVANRRESPRPGSPASSITHASALGCASSHPSARSTRV